MQTLYYDAPSNASREEDDEESKNCSKIVQNLLYCSLGYIYKHTGTPNFLVKVLWVYSHLKSNFFVEEKVTKCHLELHQSIENHLKVAQRRTMTWVTIF